MGWLLVPVRVDVWLIDSDQTRLATTGLWIPLAQADLAQAFVIAYADLLYAICNVGIERLTTKQAQCYTPHTTTQQVPGSDLHQIAQFIFSSATPEQRGNIWIPSAKDEIFIQTGTWAGIAIDTEREDVIALINMVVNGVEGVYVGTPEQQKLTALTSAYKQVRDAISPDYSRRYRRSG